METLLTVLVVLLLVVSVVLYVLLRRALDLNDAYLYNNQTIDEENAAFLKSNETMEAWFDEFKTRVMTAYQRIKAIDASGHFEADDEVGYFFKELKSLIQRLYELGIMDEIEKETTETITTGNQKISTEKLQEVLASRRTATIGKVQEK